MPSFPKPVKRRKPLRSKTGELELFKEIWRGERLHQCEVCSKKIYNFDPVHFAHVISKGARTDLRLKALNILIMCFDCHNKYDHRTHKAKENPMFFWVFELKDYIKSKFR